MEKTNVLQQIKLNKIIYPILIGLGVIAYMLYSDINADKLNLKLTTQNQLSDWYSYSINDSNTIVEIQITDTLILQQDSISIELSYWAGESNQTEFFTDTVLIKHHHTQNCVHSRPLYKIRCGENNKLYFSFNKPLRNVLNGLNITRYSIIFLLIALSMMFVRDISYTWRIRVLTDNQLGWKQALKVILLWEFTSALTPSAIGGSAVAILLLNKEGIRLGRSTAVVMASIFLDEMYFLIFVPIMFIFISGSELFALNGLLGEGVSMYNEFFYFALIGYIAIFSFTAFLAYGLFINPRGLKWLIIKIFRFRLLRKWLYGAAQTGNEIIISSKELLNKNYWFWVKSSLATFFSWTARYWIVNLLLLAFFSVSDHLLIFARQLVMWVMMLVSPTPGGSGFSEYVFATYLGDFIPSGLETALALIWRFITYYPYLLIGAIIFPRWVNKKFKLKKLNH